MKKKYNELLLIGLAGTFFFGSFFAGEYLAATSANQDIWWTPMTMALSLDQSRAEFELYVRGDLLQKRVETGTVWLMDKQGKLSKVTAEDVKIRFNNRYKVKAEKLHKAVFTAFMSGISIALLVTGLVRFFKDKRKSVGVS